MPQVLLFDVNETLLDVHALGPELMRIFGQQTSVREFFVEVLQHTLALTLVGEYRDLDEIAGAVLRMTAAGRRTNLADSDYRAVLNRMTSLPAHPDVQPALGRLKDLGFRLATLTNSSTEAQRKQLDYAGLTEYFERTISVDSVRRFKPAPEPYLKAAGELHVDPGEMTMIAAHGWDVLGAMRAGLKGAFVARPGKAPFPIGPQPQMAGATITDLADRFIAKR